MHRMRYTILFGFVVAFTGLLIGVRPSAGDVHELTTLGLPDAPGRDQVEGYCSICHSLKLVVQQGLPREDWDELMVWMVDEQDMEEIEAEDRRLVLDYLAKYVSIEATLAKRKKKRKLK